MSGGILLDRKALEAFPLPNIEEGDKHSHGRLLIVAGSRTLAGAALLCAMAAMRSGTGKLQIATVASVAPQIAVAMPESRTIGLDEDKSGAFGAKAAKEVAKLAENVDAVVAGPGMFRNSACETMAAALLKADAALALDAGILRALPPKTGEAKRAKGHPILLPHAGEMAALLECDEAAVDADPVGCAKACSKRYDAITLVKGAVSHIVHPDGRVWTHKGGSPGLGVSGSGDTLAGIVGGVLARGADPLTALLWGERLHGEAGKLLSRTVGPAGFLAREIPDLIPGLLAR